MACDPLESLAVDQTTTYQARLPPVELWSGLRSSQRAATLFPVFLIFLSDGWNCISLWFLICIHLMTNEG